jgi:hypothetical protein
MGMSVGMGVGTGVGAYRIVAAVSVTLMTVLSGCGSDHPAGGSTQGMESSAAERPATRTATPSRSPSLSRSPSPSPTPTLTPTGTAASDGTDVSACFDGRCEVALSKPTRIAVDSRFGVSELSVTRITSGAVALEGTGGGGAGAFVIGPGGTGGMNSLSFRVESITDGTAVLTFFPKK